MRKFEAECAATGLIRIIEIPHLNLPPLEQDERRSLSGGAPGAGNPGSL
jgi:hypothetical protein